jgi:ACS family allantoate permease-like MFS transporter
VFWSVLISILLPDSPTTCWYFSERERYICVKRISDNNTGLEDKKIKWYQVKECLLDPKTWLIAMFACAQNIPNGGLVTFSAIIVKGLGYDTLTTMLLGIPTGVIATLWQLVLAVPCSKLANKRCTVIALANIFPMICAILMWKLPRENKNGLLAAYYVFYTYWGPYVMSTSVPMANVSGHTKKVTVNAIYFLAYCTGNIIGPQVFRSSDAPDYSHGYIALLACLVLASCTIALYGVLCRWDNASRDREGERSEAGNPSGRSEQVFSDRTDKEKREFRYMY